MEEKHRDLKSTKQKRIIENVVQTLSKSDPQLYYLSTIELAAQIQNHISEHRALSKDDYDLVKDLSRRDIQLILSLHN